MAARMNFDFPAGHRILKSIVPVVNQARFVAFDPDSAWRFVEQLTETDLTVPPWDRTYHFHDGSARTVQYLFLLDCLNFCFWGEPRWGIERERAWLTGYEALAASLKDAVERGAPILDAAWMSRAQPSDLADLFKSRTEMPLLAERAAIVREAGEELLRQFGGQAAGLVEAAGGSIHRLLDLLLAYFPNFRDVAHYSGRQVFFLKRAQIFCADLYAAFGGRAWGRFDDIAELTAFADYRLPQLLRREGILRFSPELARCIENRELIPAGSDEEIEIRATTIYAVEVIKRMLSARGINRLSIEVDWILWGRTRGLDSPPHHRTITTFY